MHRCIDTHLRDVSHAKYPDLSGSPNSCSVKCAGTGDVTAAVSHSQMIARDAGGEGREKKGVRTCDTCKLNISQHGDEEASVVSSVASRAFS